MQINLPSDFQLKGYLGSGAFGKVFVAEFLPTGKQVAIKKIDNAFHTPFEAGRTYREIHILECCDHGNIMRLFGILPPPPTVNEFSDVYLVTEYMDGTLETVIKGRFALREEHVQFIMFQILRALRYMHSAGIVHRDIKPQNILINSSCYVKLCDFGMARSLSPDYADETPYVCTRWYRAPEVLLLAQYGFPVDIWAAGCVWSEIVRRRPLFPGTNVLDQLEKIHNFVGSQPPERYQHVTDDLARRHYQSLPSVVGTDMKEYNGRISDDGIDLLRRMLIFDPRERITAEAALQHPYMRPFMELNPDQVANFQFRFEEEAAQLPVNVIKERIFEHANTDFNAMTRLLHEPV